MNSKATEARTELLEWCRFYYDADYVMRRVIDRKTHYYLKGLSELIDNSIKQDVSNCFPQQLLFYMAQEYLIIGGFFYGIKAPEEGLPKICLLEPSLIEISTDLFANEPTFAVALKGEDLEKYLNKYSKINPEFEEFLRGSMTEDKTAFINDPEVGSLIGYVKNSTSSYDPYGFPDLQGCVKISQHKQVLLDRTEASPNEEVNDLIKELNNDILVGLGVNEEFLGIDAKLHDFTAWEKLCEKRSDCMELEVRLQRQRDTFQRKVLMLAKTAFPMKMWRNT
jgi:hypothetical protein